MSHVKAIICTWKRNQNIVLQTLLLNINQCKNFHSSLQSSLKIGAPVSRTKLLIQDE